MKLRVGIEFVGMDRLQITKFSGQKTINIKSFNGNTSIFDFNSFSLVKNSEEASNFCLVLTGGSGVLSDPYSLAVYQWNYDTGRFELAAELDAKNNRKAIVEGLVLPRK
jgi:hypothetical protein